MINSLENNVWHDSSIEKIVIEYNDIVERALDKIAACNNTKSKGGGVRDINAHWRCVVIKLIDGICIRIVCNSTVFES